MSSKINEKWLETGDETRSIQADMVLGYGEKFSANIQVQCAKVTTNLMIRNGTIVMEADDFVIIEKKDIKKADQELKYRGPTSDFCGGIDSSEIVSDLSKVQRYDSMIEKALTNPTEVTHMLGEDLLFFNRLARSKRLVKMVERDDGKKLTLETIILPPKSSNPVGPSLKERKAIKDSPDKLLE